MLVVLVMAGAIWVICAGMGAPRRIRRNLLVALFFCILAIQIILPLGHPLRLATGSHAGLWVLIAGFYLVFLTYRAGLRYLRARAQNLKISYPSQEVSARHSPLGEAELTRYARHIILPQIGGMGQMALKRASVLVIGAGGLGAPALLYLAAAGVGRIGVIDPDVVEAGNLQRQIIHTQDRIGMPKVFSAQIAMRAQNPYVDVFPYHRAFCDEIAAPLMAQYDVVLDGTDDPQTRYRVNAACVAAGVPLVSGALSQWEGQLSVFDPAHGAPCYRCIFDSPPTPGLAPDCAEGGVLGPLPGIIGTMMAAEAIKLITRAGTSLRGQMLIHDALWGESRKIALKPRVDCPVCARGQR